MEDIIEIRYAGTVIAKAVASRDEDASGFFVSVTDPMPVGSILTMRLDKQTKYGRVDQVIESAEPTHAGMRLHFVDGPPAPPSPSPSAPRPVPAPAVVAAPADDDGSKGSDDGTGPGDAGGPESPDGSGGGGGRRRRRRR